jgi:hypothetical protein
VTRCQRLGAGLTAAVSWSCWRMDDVCRLVRWLVHTPRCAVWPRRYRRSVLTVHRHTLDAIGDACRDYRDDGQADQPTDAYRAGVEDLARYLSGSAGPTPELGAILAQLDPEARLDVAAAGPVVHRPRSPIDYTARVPAYLPPAAR